MSEMSSIPLYSRSSDIRNLALNNGCEASSLLSWLYQTELPDTVWFILGTACHEAIETCILNDLNREELIAEGRINLSMALAEAGDNIIESASARSKRGLDTVKADVERILGKWYDAVHPDGERRNKLFNQYQWPPKVEHEIVLHDTDETALYTTIDAIFTAKPGEAKFGADIMIVDWKTGSTSKSSPAQLQVYAYGGRKEGWYPDDNATIGMFWHVDHEKPQWVDTYHGDEVIEKWIARTYDAKQKIIEDSMPVYAPDWYCGYCQSKDICPVNNPGGGKKHDQIALDIQSARLLTEPEREAEQHG